MLDNASETVDYALKQCGVNKVSFISNEQERDQWFLDSINIVGSEFYTRLLARLPNSRDLLETTYDFLTLSDLSPTDVQSLEENYQKLFPAGQKIKKVLVKYTADGGFRRADFVDFTSIPTSIGDLEDRGTAGRPVYTTFRNKIYITPTPTKTVLNGFKLITTESWEDITSMATPFELLPITYRKVLVSGLKALIYERLQDTDRKLLAEEEFESRMDRAVMDLTDQTGINQQRTSLDSFSEYFNY